MCQLQLPSKKRDQRRGISGGVAWWSDDSDGIVEGSIEVDDGNCIWIIKNIRYEATLTAVEVVLCVAIEDGDIVRYCLVGWMQHNGD